MLELGRLAVVVVVVVMTVMVMVGGLTSGTVATALQEGAWSAVVQTRCFHQMQCQVRVLLNQ